jgi:hypothetical protein
MMQQESQNARLIGEPLKTVVQQTGSSLSEQTNGLAPEPVQRVVDCPLCVRPVPYPGPASDGSEARAECAGCDVYFGFDSEEAYTPPQGLESDLRTSQEPGF